nr:MAG TPA: hypothetical protein [Caudoviricetes sp.]
MNRLIDSRYQSIGNVEENRNNEIIPNSDSGRTHQLKIPRARQ